MRDDISGILRRDGINGLKLIPRIPPRPQDKTNMPITPDLLGKMEEPRIDPVAGIFRWRIYREGDYRRYGNIGYPVEDYCIDRGNGSPLMVIREVQSQVEGMKKYALIDLPEKPTPDLPTRIIKKLFHIKETKKEKREALKPVTYKVRYVYSEGIDIAKMVEDKEYAKAVIDLLSQKRLTTIENMSREEMGTDIVYVGTIGKNEGVYEKFGIKNYMVAVSRIHAKLTDRESARKESTEEASRKQAKKEKEERIGAQARGYSKEDWKIILEHMIAEYGVDAVKKLLEEAGAEFKQNPFSIEDIGEEPEEYYW